MLTRRSRKWLIGLLMAALFFLTLAVVLSRIFASKSARHYLTLRLEQAFGRPVDVSNFDIRWFPTPGIVAERVTIGEDPRFGHEYFLRAESIVASPRWRSLFAARLELGTLELSHPSLNLVRNPDGRWNVESWLPPSAVRTSQVSSTSHSTRVAAQLSRIEIDTGRINFSRGIDRRPFALEDLTGSIEQESPGRWRIALVAHPLRATVHLQNSGTLSVAGIIAGTSARLHPADVTITWSNASLADALRLALGNDPGVRGDFGLQVKAHTEVASASDASLAGSATVPARWNISASARVTGLHRWDMPARPDNPAVNVAAEAEWNAGASQITLRKLSVEAPHSRIDGNATVTWSSEIIPDVRLNSSGIAFEDLFAWYRAFQPGVAEGLSVAGFLTGDTEFSGWPARAQAGRIESDGATLKAGAITLAKSGHIQTRLDPSVIEVLPIVWTLAGSANRPATAANPVPGRMQTSTLGFQAKLYAPGLSTGKEIVPFPWRFDIGLHGDFAHFEDLLNDARLLGRPLNKGWQVEGGLTGNLRWVGKLQERFPKATGDVSPRAAILKLPLLNQSIEIANARIELQPGEQRVTIVDAVAFGTRWQGTIWRGVDAAPPSWQFDLAADHLDAAELDRWIGPRARPNWLTRIFAPDTNTSSQVAGPGPLSQLRAHGSLRIDAFTLAPLELQKVRAEVEMLGRNVNFSEFDAKLNGGTISGGLLASLDADPGYWLHASVRDVSITELAAPSFELRDRVSGLLSGDMRLSLHGIGREKLLDSLKGEGHISATRVGIRGLDLSAPADESAARDFGAQFSLVNADVTVDLRKIRFQKVALVDGAGSYEGSGTSDFSRAILFQLWPRVELPRLKRTDVHLPEKILRVNGSLEAPHVFVEPISTSTTQPVPASVRH
jgi:uncharacterized protein involved in outer membrane biogenesis